VPESLTPPPDLRRRSRLPRTRPITRILESQPGGSPATTHNRSDFGSSRTAGGRVAWAMFALATSTGANADYAIQATAWFTALVAIATIVLDVLTLHAVWTQDARARLSQGIALLNRYSDQWNSDRLKESRAIIASRIRKQQIDAAAIDQSIELSAILDLFEDLGFLIERGVLDAEHVWTAFGEPILVYHRSLRAEIAKFRQQSPTVWVYLEGLNRRMDELEHKYTRRYRKRRKHADISRTDPSSFPNKDDIDEFLASDELLTNRVAAKRKLGWFGLGRST
jgi:hypothetical protein